MIRAQLMFILCSSTEKFHLFEGVRNPFKTYHETRDTFSEDMADSFTHRVLQTSRINSHTADNRGIKAALALIAGYNLVPISWKCLLELESGAGMLGVYFADIGYNWNILAQKINFVAISGYTNKVIGF